MDSPIRYDPTADHDPHRYNSDVHYRLFLSHRDNQPAVICVQDFDYPDYDAERFLSPDAWIDKVDAERALSALLRAAEILNRGTVTVVQICSSGC